MTALCGWLLALVLVAPQAGDDETRDRRESIRTRRLYDLINEKVATDARNTNLVETDDLTFYDLSPLQGETLQGSDGNSITIQKDVTSGGKTGLRKETYRYRISYLPATFDMPLQIMRVVETVRTESTRRLSFQGTDAAAGSGKRNEVDTTVTEHSLDLEDILLLQSRATPSGGAGGTLTISQYDALEQLLITLERKARVSPLRAKESGNEIDPHFYNTAESNRDFIRYARVNDHHPFADIVRDERPYSIEATFSSLTFGHKLLYAGAETIGIHGFGFEMGFGDRVLNLISFQSPALTWGVRLLLFFNDARGSVIDSSFFLNVRVLGRSPVNTASLIDRWHLNAASPVMNLDQPRLNTTPGTVVEITTGAPYYRLPFFTFLYAGGNTEYADPFVKFGSPGAEYAYYSVRQWEASLGFFWNTDEAMYNRFRFDIGAGTYDIRQVQYDSQGKYATDTKARGMSEVQPLLQVNYTHVSGRARFGANVRLFDNRLTFTPWLKIIDRGLHELRLEAIILPRPIGRSLHPWEAERANLLQLRYRYGFDKNW
jgi:hypothetical protein